MALAIVSVILPFKIANIILQISYEAIVLSNE
jgi:hypothetical protein